MLLLLGGAAAQAHADEATDVARDAYDKGMAHYQLEEYDAAVEEWERGFRAKPKPEFLYNIAQAYRLSKRPDKALSFYRKYLRMAPNAKNRAEVERHIASLEDVIAKQKAAAEAPSQQPIAPTPQPGAPPPATAPTGGVPVGAATSTTPAESGGAGAAGGAAASGTRADLVATHEERPVYKKGWFWGVMGGVAAVVVAGVVVGVVYGTRSTTATLGDVRFP